MRESSNLAFGDLLLFPSPLLFDSLECSWDVLEVTVVDFVRASVGILLIIQIPEIHLIIVEVSNRFEWFSSGSPPKL